MNDYFQLSYEEFINRHFRGQKGKLKRPITEKKFREIFGKLSEEQLAVVKDKEHEKILVGAGPGSGKTRVLVHKVAALLLMEDIKPEQFLMLTFSRSAAAEFKERLQQLIGRTAYHIDIFTYHGFAFQLLGRVGDLKKSDNVILQATEALQAYRLLRQAGIAAHLIASQEGYSLRQLLELKCFSLYLHEELSQELGFISPDSWSRCRQRISQQFAQSADLPLALEVIGIFEREAGPRKFWSEWLAYLYEIRVEDFVFAEATKVLVSTMHKAKGKEFDHVFLLLQHYPLLSEARKRVVYVAITRARESLHIHTDQPYFDPLSAPELQTATDPNIYPVPEELQLELGMSDVWLGFFRQPSNGGLPKSLAAGSPLVFAAVPTEGLLSGGRFALKFSQKFRERLSQLLSQGYITHSAAVAHMLVWYCEEDDKENRVALPRVILRRNISLK